LLLGGRPGLGLIDEHDGYAIPHGVAPAAVVADDAIVVSLLIRLQMDRAVARRTGK
jgi:hypothetical protein